jgi:hypothetical protein
MKDLDFESHTLKLESDSFRERLCNWTAHATGKVAYKQGVMYCWNDEYED